MSIVVIGAVFVDVKGYPNDNFVPTGRNAGRVEHVHGGVGRNLVEDIANCELRPTFVSLVDDTGEGADVIQKLQNHKVNTDYMLPTRDGMGTWLAVFDNDGDVAASISKRPNLLPIAQILEEHGDTIIGSADSVVLEIDMDKEIVKAALKLAKKHGKKVYAVVGNISIAMERRDFFKSLDCFICNVQETGTVFFDDYSGKSPLEMADILSEKVVAAQFQSMIVTMGGKGAVYADIHGQKGVCPARNVEVKDTTGAGDSFGAGVSIGLTYGKSLKEACEIGAMLAASVIITTDNVCPRFLPRELGIDVEA